MNAKELYEMFEHETQKRRDEFRREYAKLLLSLPLPMSYEVWCYLHSITDLRDDLNE